MEEGTKEEGGRCLLTEQREGVSEGEAGGGGERKSYQLHLPL